MGSALAFFLFAGLTILCGLICLFHRSVVHSAFALMGTLLGVAGLYLTLGADFLAMTQVLIYVGGILMLLLFGLMLTPGDPTERKLSRIFLGLALVGGLGALFVARMGGAGDWVPGADAATLPPPEPTVTRIGLAFLDRDQYLLPFELASIILLAALIGAVYIARQRVAEPGEGGGR